MVVCLRIWHLTLKDKMFSDGNKGILIKPQSIYSNHPNYWKSPDMMLVLNEFWLGWYLIRSMNSSWIHCDDKVALMSLWGFMYSILPSTQRQRAEIISQGRVIFPLSALVARILWLVSPYKCCLGVRMRPNSTRRQMRTSNSSRPM